MEPFGLCLETMHGIRSGLVAGRLVLIQSYTRNFAAQGE